MRIAFFLFLLNALCAETWNAQVLENNVLDPDDLTFAPFSAMNDQGVAIVRWTEKDSFKSSYSLDGGISWSSIHTFNTEPYFLYHTSSYHPLSMNAQGEALFSWSEVEGMTHKVSLKVSFFSPQVGWGAAHTFSTNGTSYSNLNHVIGNNGRTVISWREDPNSLFSAFYERAFNT